MTSASPKQDKAADPQTPQVAPTTSSTPGRRVSFGSGNDGAGGKLFKVVTVYVGC